MFVPPYKYTEENFVCMFQYVSICFNIDKSKILQPTLTSLYIYIKLQQFRTLIYPNKITLEREYLFWVNGTKIIMPSPISPWENDIKWTAAGLLGRNISLLD